MPQATLFVPIADPPRRIPTAIDVDIRSEWHTSALISSAVESVTLPSRLRRFHDIEAALIGDDANRKIFELQSSVIQEHAEHESIHLEPSAQTRFDLDFTYDHFATKSLPQIFNQIQVYRGQESLDTAEDSKVEDLGSLRKQKLLNSDAIVQRYVDLRLPVFFFN